MQEIIKCYALRVSSTNKACRGFIREMIGTIEAFKDYIGGEVDVVSLFDTVVAVIDLEKSVAGYPKNRVLITEERKVVNYLCGHILIARMEGDKFTSILEEDIPKIEAIMPAFYLTYIEEDKVLHMLKSELPISGEEYYGWEKYLEKLKERELMLYRKLYGEEE